MLEVNYLMRCCGVKEINGLSYHRTSAAALLEFCKMIYPTQEANDKVYKAALKRAAEAGCKPWDDRYVGGSSVGAVYEDLQQYAKFRFAIFTEARAVKSDQPPTYGQRFAELIRNCKLGTLVSTARHELNPNSGHEVMVWVWGIDHDALKAWYKKNRPKEEVWEQKPMSAVIGGAAAVGSLSGSLAAGCGTTIVSAGTASISNADLPTSGSSHPTSR